MNVCRVSQQGQGNMDHLGARRLLVGINHLLRGRFGVLIGLGGNLSHRIPLHLFWGGGVREAGSNLCSLVGLNLILALSVAGYLITLWKNLEIVLCTGKTCF